MKALLTKLLAYVILIWAVAGLFVVVVAPVEIYNKWEAESWPSRPAVITLSYAILTSGGKGNAAYWRTHICGNYMAGGERFCIARVRYGEFRWGAGEREAKDAVARYPVGRPVDVYYLPSNPKVTILESRSSWRAMITLYALGSVGLLIPLILWLFRKKNGR